MLSSKFLSKFPPVGRDLTISAANFLPVGNWVLTLADEDDKTSLLGFSVISCQRFADSQQCAAIREYGYPRTSPASEFLHPTHSRRAQLNDSSASLTTSRDFTRWQPAVSPGGSWIGVSVAPRNRHLGTKTPRELWEASVQE